MQFTCATRFMTLASSMALGALLACSSRALSVPDEHSNASASAGGRSNGGSSPGAGSAPITGGGNGANAGNGGNRANAGNGATAGNGGNGATAGDAGGNGANAGNGATAAGASPYDALVLADRPVAFWAMNLAPMPETDLTGNGHEGSYRGPASHAAAVLPNGDVALDFDGGEQYLTVPSSPAFSIPTTGTLTWEAWLRPDVLQFPHDDGVSGYVDWLGKCEDYGPTCEWEARMYDSDTRESPNRPNRLSAYVFNPSAGLGSAADWQPSPGLVMAGAWYHLVGEYTILAQPADCQNTAAAPGSIDIWVNGLKWNHSAHGQTGCMSQYNVVPKANGSPLNIATMSKESFFRGAIAKVAIYDQLLSQPQITSHYTQMTGKQPIGSCAATCNF